MSFRHVHWVVAVGERDHELPRLLCDPAERDPILLEDNGRDESHLVPKEGIAALGASGEEADGQPLQALAVLRGNGIPGLGLPEVQVVDAVQVHVLRVPGEGGLPHAEVQVGGVNALDDGAALTLHHVQDGPQVPDVPLGHVVIVQGAADVGPIDG